MQTSDHPSRIDLSSQASLLRLTSADLSVGYVPRPIQEHL